MPVPLIVPVVMGVFAGGYILYDETHSDVENNYHAPVTQKSDELGQVAKIALIGSAAMLAYHYIKKR